MLTTADSRCIDAARLLETVDGDLELLKELFDLFRTDTPQQIADIRAALAAGDTAALASVAHTLKGAASSLQLVAVARQAQLIETTARQGELVATAEAFADLELALADVPHAFQSVLTSP